jgi:DNA-binding MarR family transcriptional regulator/ribosomal protein S18 acetylase RimI-like enzyme
MESLTSRVRDFNRFYTQRIGVLTDRYLDQRPLGEARLLYEIGATGDVSAVRTRLGLDSGYLSRMLRSLQRQGLVELRAHPADARARIATLTPAGQAARSELDTRSEQAVAGLVDPLTPAQRERLATAMDEVQRLLRLAAITIEAVPAGSAAARSCLSAYAHELSVRFPEGYDAAELTPPEQFTPPKGVLLVAFDGPAGVGCVGLRTLEPGVGEIRHLWVHDRMRRSGLGGRLLRGIEARALALGLPKVRLNTHTALPEALALYRAAGYAETSAYSDDVHGQVSFVKQL